MGVITVSGMRFLAIPLVVLGLACAPVEEVRTLPTDTLADLSGVDGAVEFLNLEGGCWAIKVADRNYQPINLASEFKQDGLRVRVTMHRLDNMGSVCMIGPMVQIESIARR